MALCESDSHDVIVFPMYPMVEADPCARHQTMCALVWAWVQDECSLVHTPPLPEFEGMAHLHLAHLSMVWGYVVRPRLRGA